MHKATIEFEHEFKEKDIVHYIGLEGKDVECVYCKGAGYVMVEGNQYNCDKCSGKGMRHESVPFIGSTEVKEIRYKGVLRAVTRFEYRTINGQCWYSNDRYSELLKAREEEREPIYIYHIRRCLFGSTEEAEKALEDTDPETRDEYKAKFK